MKKTLLAAVFLALASAASAEIHFGVVDSDDHHYFRSSGFSSFEVRYAGEIEVSPDQERIVSISPGGFLEIETRRLFTPRKVRVTPGAQGLPELRYWRADRRGTEAEAREYLERNLPEAVRVTAVGASAEARRLLAAGGPRRVLSALAERDSQEAHEIFLETIVEGPPVDAATGAALIRDAAREISGSSRLSRLLVGFAHKLPPDPTLTASLARACDDIASSSARRAALSGIADARGIPPAAIEDFSRSASEISSSSEKASAIEHLSTVSADPQVLARLAEAAESIDSSTSRHRALQALATRAGTGPALVRVLRAGEGIASSTEKAEFLAEAAPFCTAPDAVRAYLRTAESIDSSSGKRRALVALLGAGIPGESWGALMKTAARIESSAEKAAVLVRAAASPAVDARMLEAYLGCAESIESSAEKRRSLVALLRRGLPPDQAALVMRFAEREISSSSEREAVLREAMSGKS